MTTGPSRHDYRIAEAHLFNEDLYELPDNIKSERLKDTVRFFVENMKRVHALSFLPIYLPYTGILHGNVPFWDEQKIESKDFLGEHLNGQREFDVYSFSCQASPWIKPETLEGIKITGKIILDNLSSLNIPMFDRGLDAILASIIAAAWTAFEATAEDLWTIAVNSYPSPFAERVIDWKRPGSSGDGDKQARNERKTIELWVLKKHKFNLEIKMGDVLKTQGKISFDCLEAIDKAYAKIFEGQSASIFKKHQKLYIVEAVRNLYAHRAGKVDEKFKARVKNEPLFNTFDTDDVLKLDEAIVKSFVSSIMVCSLDLINFVDDRLVEREG